MRTTIYANHHMPIHKALNGMGRRQRLTLQVAVSVTLLWFILSQVDSILILKSISRIGLERYTMAFCAVLAAQLIAVAKWRLLQTTTSAWTLFKLLLVGQLYNFLFGNQVSGDVARFAYSRSGDKRDMHRLATVLVDRLLSLLGMSVLCCVSIAGSDHTTFHAFLFPTAVVSIGGGLVVVACWKGIPGRYADTVATRFSRSSRLFTVTSFISRLSQELQLVIQSAHIISANFLLGLLYQIGMALCSFVIGGGIGLKLNVFDYLIISAITQTAALVPIGIGGIGIKDLSSYLILCALGETDSQAAMFTVALYPIVLLYAIAGMFAEFGSRRNLWRKNRPQH